jgi:hypothetical protein
MRIELPSERKAKCVRDQISSGYNQRDFFFFYCFGPNDPDSGSDKIGTFAVSKTTAAV